jgi:hypothetical protein
MRLMWQAFFRGPLRTKTGSASDAWCGRVTFPAGSTAVLISTTQVDASAVIVLTPESNTRQNSGVCRPFEVASRTAGTGFYITTADGVALARDTVINWWLVRSR